MTVRRTLKALRSRRSAAQAVTGSAAATTSSSPTPAAGSKRSPTASRAMSGTRPRAQRVLRSPRQPGQGGARIRRGPAEGRRDAHDRDLHLHAGDGHRHRLGARSPRSGPSRCRGAAPAPRPLRSPRQHPPTLRIHVAENAPEPGMNLDDELRTQLVQTIAMVELMGREVAGTAEHSPTSTCPHCSSRSSRSSRNRAAPRPAACTARLCGRGPSAAVGSTDVRSPAAGDGRRRPAHPRPGTDCCSPGGAATGMINHYSFYAAFHTAEEFRVLVRLEHRSAHYRSTARSGRQPADLRRPALADPRVDPEKRTIQLTPSSGGKAPPFTPGGPLVADTVRQRMRALYLERPPTGLPRRCRLDPAPPRPRRLRPASAQRVCPARNTGPTP